MELDEFAATIPGLAALQHVQKIKVFAWHLHTNKKQDFFTAADIRRCYDSLHIDQPANVNRLLDGLNEKKPKELLKNKSGYALERGIRDALAAKYGQRATTIQVHQLLLDLPSKIPGTDQKAFLSEAIICLRHGAPRAAIIMTWNLAFDHLCDYVFNGQLAAFNARWPIRFPNHHRDSSIKTVTKKDDFTDAFKESEVLEICKSANIINANLFRMLNEKLGRRNTAAHPNSMTFTPLQAEDYITDLVNNVVLVLK